MSETKRTRMMRLISNGVPSNRIAGGKKSLIDGPWKPESLEAVATETRSVLAISSSALSSVSGRGAGFALAATNVGVVVCLAHLSVTR